jgi:hypothetical protein
MHKIDSDFRFTLLFNLLIVAVALSHVFSRETEESHDLLKAYLDPGTGSMIISAIVGVFATIILGLKTLRYKIVDLFRPKKKSQDKNSGDR